MDCEHFCFFLGFFFEMELLHAQIESNSNFLCVLKVMFAACCQHLREMSKVTVCYHLLNLGSTLGDGNEVPR